MKPYHNKAELERILSRAERIIIPKGSRKNKFAILGVQAPGWQGAQAQEYQAYFELTQRSQAGCMGA